MSLQSLSEQIQHAFPVLLYGFLFSLWGGICAAVAHAAGYRRGVNRQPDAAAAKWREEHFKRLVAEERAETAERVSKRFELAMLETVAARQEQERERLRLVERSEARSR